MTEDQLLERAKKAVPNQGLTWVAVLAAQQHRYAIEYIEQAPVLVIGATYGKVCKCSSAERAFIANRFRRIEGLKLKAAMAAFHLPYPLRKLRSTAIAPGYATLLWALRSIPPSALSQAIPERTGHQVAWLGALKAAEKRVMHRQCSLPEGGLEWLATRITPSNGTPAKHLAAKAADIADMFIGGRFNPAWTFEEAVSAHAKWVVDITRRDNLKSFAMTYGVGLDYQVDYAPQPNEPSSVAEFEFVPLRSGEDLIVEGTMMRHCVPSYMRDVLSATSCLYSMRKGGKRIATLELSSGNRPVVRQLKGPCNAAVAADVQKAADLFAAGIHQNNRSAIDKLKELFRPSISPQSKG